MDANEQRIDAHLAHVDDDAGREPDTVVCDHCERTLPASETYVYGYVESDGLCGPVRRPMRKCYRCRRNMEIWLKYHGDDEPVYRPPWAHGRRGA